MSVCRYKVLVAFALGVVAGGWECAAMTANVVAGSVAEFSSTQGQDNWFYGYYEGTFSPSSFQEMTVRRNGWHVDPNPPEPSYWTNLTEQGGHPNGPLAGCCRTHVEQWAVRRYLSEVAGTVILSGLLSDLDEGNGDGIEGFIYVDGVEVFGAIIADGDLTGVSYSAQADVNVGSVIDFAIAPRANDFEDTTRFTAVVTLVPEPGSLALFAVGVAAFGWRKR